MDDSHLPFQFPVLLFLVPSVHYRRRMSDLDRRKRLQYFVGVRGAFRHYPRVPGLEQYGLAFGL